jgi:hypothetical protein
MRIRGINIRMRNDRLAEKNRYRHPTGRSALRAGRPPFRAGESGNV